ncbi:hypothetical protein HMPREF2548_05580, partial [Staphylococcus sp. HMSC067G10]
YPRTLCPGLSNYILPIVVRNKSVLVTSVLIQGPQQREFHMEIPQAKQAGVGAQQREFHMEILQNHYFSSTPISYIV